MRFSGENIAAVFVLLLLYEFGAFLVFFCLTESLILRGLSRLVLR